MVLDKVKKNFQNTPDFWVWPVCLHQACDFGKTKTVISHDKRTYNIGLTLVLQENKKNIINIGLMCVM